MKPSVVLMSIGIGFGAFSCSSNSVQNTAPFTTIAISRVSGIVTDANGTGLDSVRVFIVLPNSAGYAGGQAVTNSAGRYTADVLRMYQVGNPTIPDTVRVEVSAQLLKGPNANSAAGTVRSNKVLTFSSNIESPPTQQLDIKFQQ